MIGCWGSDANATVRGRETLPRAPILDQRNFTKFPAKDFSVRGPWHLSIVNMRTHRVPHRSCKRPTMRSIVAAALLFIVTACGERGTAPKPVIPTPVAIVTIEPVNTSLEAGQQAVIEARTRDANGGMLSGRTVQWQSSAPTVASVAGSGSGASATVTAVAPGVATITATSEGRVASASVTVVASRVVDFSITDAQWTQGAQQADGTIPMVLDGNAAVLNVLMATTGTGQAPGQLMLTVTDASGGIVRRDSVTPRAFTGSASYEEPTAQFLMPSSQLQTGLRWSVRRDPGKRVADGDSVNDVYPRAVPATLSTVSLPVLRIRFVPIVLTVHGSITGNVSTGNVEGYLPTVRRIFPMGRLATTVGTPLSTFATFGTPPTGGADAFWRDVLQDLRLARVADASEPDAHWMGVVAPPPGFTFATFGGFATVSSTGSAATRIQAVVQTGWFNNTGQTSDLVAHELAHAYGRRHAPCGNATGTDAAFPVANGTIGTPGHDVYTWSRGISGLANTKPATTGDIMGYCFPQWASPYTYNGILQARAAEGPIPVATAPTDPVRRQRVLVVRGAVVDHRVSLLPAVSIEGTATDGSHGAYLVELVAEDGRLLASHRTDAVAVDHSNALLFLAAVPLDELAESSLETVRVSGPAGVAIRRRAATALRQPVAAQTTARRATASLRARSSGGYEAVCADPRAVAIAVQERSSGALLASAAASSITLAGSNVMLVDIICSDGVRSMRTSATMPSR